MYIKPTNALKMLEKLGISESQLGEHGKFEYNDLTEQQKEILREIIKADAEKAQRKADRKKGRIVVRNKGPKDETL